MEKQKKLDKYFETRSCTIDSLFYLNYIKKKMKIYNFDLNRKEKNQWFEKHECESTRDFGYPIFMWQRKFHCIYK